MSDVTSLKSQPSQAARVLVLAVLVVVAALAITTIALIGSSRLSTTTASNGQDMSDLNRGLVGSGFGSTSPNYTGRGQGPVADIAINLVVQAFSLTTQDFDKQVAAAEQLMTVGMQQKFVTQYVNTFKQELTTQPAGFSVATSLAHLQGDPKQPAIVGVTSVTATSGEFLMYVTQVTTATGTTQSGAAVQMLDVKVEKIGDTWLLSDVSPI